MGLYKYADVIGYNLKRVSVAAAERMEESTLVALYKKTVGKTKAQNVNAAAGLIVMGKCVKKVSHALTGGIDPVFNSALINYGSGFTG